MVAAGWGGGGAGGGRGEALSLVMCSLIPPVRASLVPEISYNKHIYRRVALATADSRKSGQWRIWEGLKKSDSWGISCLEF